LPRRLHRLCAGGLAAGVALLLLAAVLSPIRGPRIGRFYAATGWGLGLAGTLALAVGCAGYCFYLARLARQCGGERLARGFEAFVAAVVLFFAGPVFLLEVGILNRLLPPALTAPLYYYQSTLVPLVEAVLVLGGGVWWSLLLSWLQKRLMRQ
jgi:hypothetical protein